MRARFPPPPTGLTFLLGVHLLPAFPQQKGERIKILLDTGVILIGATLLFWSLLIAPTMEAVAAEDRLMEILSTAYPVMDLVVLFALLQLIFRHLMTEGRWPLILLAAAMTSTIVSDFVFMSQSLNETYVSGELLDIGWIIGYLFTALAGIYQAEHGNQGYRYQESPYILQYWPFYLPYLWVVGTFVLLIWSHYHPLPLSFYSLSLAVGSMIGLVIIRQIVALKENSNLYQATLVEVAERKHAEEAVKKLNEELEERVRKRTEELGQTNEMLKREVYDRKLAEGELREREARLRAIFLAAENVSFIITDAKNPNPLVMEFSPGAEKIFGYKREEIIGRPVSILHLAEDVTRLPEFLRQMKEHNVWFSETATLVRRSGQTFPALSTTYPLLDKKGEMYASSEVSLDITEAMEMEVELIRAKELAEAAARAKSEFLANMSHEIRTPMNAVIGMTDLLMTTPLNPEQRDYVETIRSSGDALLDVINDILDFSKIEAGRIELEMQPFEIRGWVEDCINMVRSASSAKGIDLQYNTDGEVPGRIVADYARLRQVLVNLLNNAVKFTERGRVSLSVSKGADVDGQFELFISVKDTGIGVPPEKMDLLFKSFSQVDSSTTRRYGGTGLGLAISKRLVELMGGRIWAKSESGMGSEFHFSVMARDPGGEAPGKDGTANYTPRYGRRRSEVSPEREGVGPVSKAAPVEGKDEGPFVLIAEDDPVNQKMTLIMLKRLGYGADVASSGEETLWALERKRYDVVMMDMQMPDKDGLEITRVIRELYGSNPRVIAMTAHLDSDRQHCLEAGMDAYLSKPFKLEELQEALEVVAGS